MCDWSRPTPLALNKLLITLLDTLGVPHSAILNLLSQAQADMEAILRDQGDRMIT